MKKFKLFMISILIAFISCSKDPIPIKYMDLTPLSLGEIVEHTYYKLAYSEEHEQAEWVFYKLYPELVSGTVKRKDNFRIDPMVSTESANLSDYIGSGYDRGHLCPAASMSYNETSMSESFFMSNMSPQHPSCNRGKWKSLETKIRTWVLNNDTLYIASGPIFKANLEIISSNNVTVPGYYYKVIYDPTGNQKMIAFIMPNKKMENDIEYYAVTVDCVETETGIDFFSGLSDDIENELEGTFDYSGWN